MKHVIIGAGAAGITAAKTIRSLRPTDEIVLLSAEEQIASRVMLYKYISGEREAEKLSFVPGDFFENNRVTWKKNTKVTAIDPDEKKVFCGEEAVTYDQLLISTGAKSTIPPVGALRTAKNVFGLRDLADALAIREAAKEAEKVVVVGAGLVGMAAAYALMELGKDVTVVEMGEDMLALNLDRQGASAYRTRFEEAGCKFHFNTAVEDTAVDHEGAVRFVTLGDGTILSCDFLVVATGARPAVAFLENSGIACEHGITVDEHMRTNFPDVYAAGDVTGLSGIWPNAMRQGEVAAKNMCQEVTVYEDTFAVKNTIHFFDLVTLTIGLTKEEPGDRVEVFVDRKGYQKLIIRDGRIVGLILQGDISNSGFWQYLIKNDIRVDNLDKPIWKVSFADFITINEEGEYRWPQAV